MVFLYLLFYMLYKKISSYFSCHICLLNVAWIYSLLLNNALWMRSLSLKDVAVNPIYVSYVLSVMFLTVAWMFILISRHLPFNGHHLFLLEGQLQFSTPVEGLSCLLYRIFLLWELILLCIFGRQLYDNFTVFLLNVVCSECSLGNEESSILKNSLP